MARHVVDGTERIEGQFYPLLPTPQRFAYWTPSIVEAVVTTAIPPFNSSTNSYGIGAAQIYLDDANSVTQVDAAYLQPEGANTNSVVVLNWLTGTGTIAVNTHILIAPRNGNWRLVTGDCNNSG
jgi:hypothetical protein